MNALLDLGSSLLATASEQGRGIATTAAGRQPAELLELYASVGQPAAQRRVALRLVAADPIAVAGNPLEDISLLAQPETGVDLVLSGGQVVHEARR